MTLKPIITISGPPAAGTSSVAEELSTDLDFEYINGGDIFRKMASERGLTLLEITKLSEDTDEIDKELDNRLQKIINQHLSGERDPDGQGLLVESRLAGCHADGRATVSVYITADVETRYSRVDGDREETIEEMREREKSEKKRYKEYYGYEMSDPSVYDLYIDTTNSVGVKATTNCIKALFTSVMEQE